MPTLPRACRAKNPNDCRVHGVPMRRGQADGQSFNDWSQVRQQEANQRRTMAVINGRRTPIQNNVTLTPEEMLVLNGYSRFDSQVINRYFYHAGFKAALHADDKYAYPNYWRGSELPNTTTARQAHLREFLAEIATLDGVTRRQRFPKPVTVYRGDNIKWGSEYELADAERDYPVGSVVARNSFLSTSANPDLAASFAGSNWAQKDTQTPATGLVFEINTTQGVVMRPFARYANEDEVLLPRDKPFQVSAIGTRRFRRVNMDLGEIVPVKNGSTDALLTVVTLTEV